ncbi:sugar phosphate nucleotidyltransferase [Methanocrinis sp.]|uniref:sugar phosphate nucleotidyltransferase n=1 Tax=Methanocrinis sp. TaxID=3101522 RepID=UPI003D13ECBF
MDIFPPVIATVGGGGTRLYPLTLDQPKPLVDLCDTAIIATLFRVLATQGCRRFVLGSKGAENTLPLNNYFKAGEGFFKRLGMNDIKEFAYQPQYDDKGSADSLRYCANYFDVKEDMLVVSGDNVIDINLRRFINFHREKKAVLTVALKELSEDENVSQYGVAEINGDQRINGFVEKPARGKEPSRMINTAFYLFSPQVREVLAEMGDSARDIGGDLIPYLTEHGYPVYGYPVEGYWIDIGTPERLLQAAMDFLGGKVEHYAFRNEYRPGQWVNPATLDRIARYLDSGDIELRGKVFIGRNCNIEKGVVIENSHIGHTSLIERDSVIKNSMVMSFANVKRGSLLNRTIVGRHSTIGTKCVLDADQSYSKPGKIPVVGENVVLPQESVVGPGTRVAPLKYSYKILATGKFSQLGTDDRNIYFCEK